MVSFGTETRSTCEFTRVTGLPELNHRLDEAALQQLLIVQNLRACRLSGVLLAVLGGFGKVLCLMSAVFSSL